MGPTSILCIWQMQRPSVNTSTWYHRNHSLRQTHTQTQTSRVNRPLHATVNTELFKKLGKVYHQSVMYVTKPHEPNLRLELIYIQRQRLTLMLTLTLGVTVQDRIHTFWFGSDLAVASQTLDVNRPLPAYLHDRIVERCTGRWFIMIFFHGDFYTILFHSLLHISTATAQLKNLADLVQVKFTNGSVEMVYTTMVSTNLAHFDETFSIYFVNTRDLRLSSQMAKVSLQRVSPVPKGQMNSIYRNTLSSQKKNIKEWRISLWWLVCKIVALS